MAANHDLHAVRTPLALPDHRRNVVRIALVVGLPFGMRIGHGVTIPPTPNSRRWRHAVLAGRYACPGTARRLITVLSLGAAGTRLAPSAYYTDCSLLLGLLGTLKDEDMTVRLAAPPDSDDPDDAAMRSLLSDALAERTDNTLGSPA